MTKATVDTLTLKELHVPGYERVILVEDPSCGLRAIICIHDTRMGPALGGTRIYPYADFNAALNDVMRLSKGMTYKSVISECSWGGGKSVIIADPKKDKSEELLMAFGEALTQLQGAYICAEDVGCNPEDVGVISRTTPYVVGIPHEKSSGNPANFTAWGTFRGVQAVLKKVFGSESIEGRTILIQGVGNVGERLAELLFWHGAKLILSDVDQKKVQRLKKLYNCQSVAPEDVYSVECDVFAPCAMGGILNPQTIAKLRCRAVAGCANNQLLNDHDADELMKRGILYAPDYLINSGGLINVTEETTEKGYDPFNSRLKINKIFDHLMLIFDIAQQNQCSTHAAACNLVEYRLKYGIGKRREPVYMHHANVCF